MNKLLTALLVAAIGFGLTLPTYAADEGMGARCKMHGKKKFTEADANKDGALDKVEAQAMHDKNFAEMDANKDGILSKDEMKACGRNKSDAKSKAMHEKQTKAFNGADGDNDGTLTKEEAQKLPRVSKNFDAIDVDKDGTLDRDEVHHFMHQAK